MDNAIETQTPLAQALARPIAISPFLVGTGVAYNEAKRVTGLGGRLFEKVKPEFTRNPGFTFFFVFRRSACRAKVGGGDEAIGRVNLTIAIAPGVISLLTESRAELAGKGQEVGEIHIAIFICGGQGTGFHWKWESG